MGELMDKLKGKIKQVEGAITGDRSRQTEGVIDEKKGDLKEKFEEAKQSIKDKFRK
ncbi:MAG TPA: CsbD family protein [Polyangia bacterium]